MSMDRVAVERVGGRVVDRHGVPVVEHLGVALFGLQFETDAAVPRYPHAAGGARDQRAGGELAGRAATATASGEAGAFEQVIGQLDVCADALDRLPGRAGE